MKNRIISMAAVAVFTAIIVLSGVAIGVHLVRPDVTPIEGPPLEVLEPPPKEGPKTIAIPGYAQLVMKAGDLIQLVELYNPAENPCYFVISIILPDGTEIYCSELIKPGQKTDAIRLSQLLDVGTYKNATLRYSCYSMEDKSPMNGADTKFTLEVV